MYLVLFFLQKNIQLKALGWKDMQSADGLHFGSVIILVTVNIMMARLHILPYLESLAEFGVLI